MAASIPELINTDEAVVFTTPLPPQSLLSLETCFLDAALALCPSREAAEVGELKAESESALHNDFCCMSLIRLLLGTLKQKNTILSRPISINEEKFDEFLAKIVKNIDENIDIYKNGFAVVDPSFIVTHSEKAFDDYFKRFKIYYLSKREEPETRQAEEWFELMIKFYDDCLIIPALANVYQTFLAREGVAFSSSWAGLIAEAAPEQFATMTSKQREQLEMQELINFGQKQVAVRAGLLADESWQPDSSIDVFLNLLKKHGPIMVNGFFGNSYHTEPATKQPIAIGGLETWAWGQGTAKATSKAGAYMHGIVVVGASKKGYERTPQDYVYWRDPGHDKMYRTSYRSFCSRVLPLNSIVQTEPPYEVATSPSVYSYYHPKTPLKKNNIAAKESAALTTVPRSLEVSRVQDGRTTESVCGCNSINTALAFAAIGTAAAAIATAVVLGS